MRMVQRHATIVGGSTLLGDESMHTVETAGGMDRHRPHRQETPLLLSVSEAAHLLGIGTTLCWEMVHSERLQSVRLGRRVLIPRVVVERMAGPLAQAHNNREGDE